VLGDAVGWEPPLALPFAAALPPWLPLVLALGDGEVGPLLAACPTLLLTPGLGAGAAELAWLLLRLASR
jgi:hypothetical protein